MGVSTDTAARERPWSYQKTPAMQFADSTCGIEQTNSVSPTTSLQET
jgi:hypothetical protein